MPLQQVHMAWEMERSWRTKAVSQVLTRCREFRDLRYTSWIWDHWRLTCPRRKLSHPMRSCSCAADRVVGSAEGQKRRAWWEERVATKQEQMDGWVSADWSHWENLVTAARKAAVIATGVLAGDHVPGGFRAVSTARTEVVVPLALLEHHMSHCIKTMQMQYYYQYWGLGRAISIQLYVKSMWVVLRVLIVWSGFCVWHVQYLVVQGLQDCSLHNTHFLVIV